MNQYNSTNISYEETATEDVFRFKRLGWSKSNLMTLGFAVLWNLIIWNVFFKGSIIIFLVPFMLIGLILLLLPFFVAYGKRSLIVNQDYIIFQIHFLGYKHKRKRFTYNIQSIEHVASKQQEGLSTIVVQTKATIPLQFGRILPFQEKEWLVSQLHTIKEKYFDLVNA